MTDIPKQNQLGAFSQVSGLQYTIDTSIKSSVKTTTSGEFVSVDGERRVKDIKVLENNTYVDLVDTKVYTLASHNFLLENGGDGFSLFMEDEALPVPVLFDYQVLINYIVDVLQGKLASKYSKTDNRIIIEPKGGDDGRIITVNKDMLYNTKLEDYRHPDKTYTREGVDKKFTIDVGNGKTIEGAIIFRDCSYQYVGETLLDAFGIKNTADTSNAYNFNILFFMDKLMRLDVAFTAHSTVYNWIDFEIKFGSLSGDDFYTSLGNVPYEWIIEHSGGDWGRRLFPGGNTAAGNYFVINTGDIPETRDWSFAWALVEEPRNVVGFNLTNYQDKFIESEGELDFNITELKFTYLSEQLNQVRDTQ